MGNPTRSCSNHLRFVRIGAILFGSTLLAAGCSSVELPATAAAEAQIAATATATGASSTESSTTTTSEPATTTTSEAPTSTTSSEPEPATIELIGELGIEVIEAFAHDPVAFTQGLAFSNGEIIESLGLYTKSEARRYTVGSQRPSLSVPLEDQFFGGGLTVVDGLVVQLTWREGKAIIRDADSLDEINSFSYEGEGWGICDDGQRLVMSDGSATLAFRDRTTFEPTGSVDITREGQPVTNLNELECVDGFVWANVWLSNEVLRINPTTGEVVAWADASSLVPGGLAADDVLNGIAFSSEDDSFFLTGKRWPDLFRVKFQPLQTDAS